WNNFDLPPIGEGELALGDAPGNLDLRVRDVFEQERGQDVFFVITYAGRTPDGPIDSCGSERESAVQPVKSVQERVSDNATEQIVGEIGQAVIEAIAPDELRQFSSASREFFKDPRRVRRRAVRRYKIIAFGATEAELLIPSVLSALTQIALFLGEEVGKEL